MQNTEIRNIPRNNVIEDNMILFLKIVNKASPVHAKKLRMAIAFDDLFCDLLNCSE